MATLIFSAIGAVIGGPIGGAIGALIGREADKAVFGSPGREGPRLKELSVTTSSYGSPVPRIFGQMRVPGTIIWATDLVEHKDKQGGGKGKPSVTTYSYTASLAVALSSRPITGIGRIWADGNLLRGAAGDLKSGGTFRLHSGHADQAPDPLIAAAEGAGGNPAYSGLAYVVFEDLQLADFGNRIPALTFEVFADEGALSISDLLDDVIDEADADVTLTGLQGLSCEGPLADTLSQLEPAFPLDCNVSGDRLAIGVEGSLPVRDLPEAALSVEDDAFGRGEGYRRTRAQSRAKRPAVLRYYDVDRDYQPGLQRAPGRPSPGQPEVVEIAAAMNANSARQIADRIARRGDWAQHSLTWRSAELDPAIGPGSLVTVPDQPGVWRVGDWEWRQTGIELTLRRTQTRAIPTPEGDPGRSNPPVDAALGVTMLQAFELPWDGSGTGDRPLIYAAASSASPGWSGAALYAEHGDGQLHPLGSSGRARAIAGNVLEQLPPASPLLFDRLGAVTIQLVSSDFVLDDADVQQLVFGANRALIGSEIIQFARAVALGDGHWRISGLLRGRGGTESAIDGHQSNEPFVLLDGTATALDEALVGELAVTRIAALGLGDETPAYSPIACRTITRRPLFPVHGHGTTDQVGTLTLRWMRRARGAWAWLDGVDVPLHEETESYEVGFGSPDDPVAVWSTANPELEITAGQMANLSTLLPGGQFYVKQRGSYALSQPSLLYTLA